MDITIKGLRKAGNAGWVTTTVAAGGDLLHTLPVRLAAGQGGRTLIIRKLVVYQVTGANQSIFIGTRDNAAAFVQLFPTLVAINAIDTIWTEEELPAVEFVRNTAAGAAGRLGDVYVIAGAIGVPVIGTQVLVEVEEFGA
ncbi:MAG: hypothetical protein WC359_12275 [Dehalococcoidia bacterium]|jgi:hypothetical protein